MQIILASASPRRQELLKNIFDDFIVHTSSCEEKTIFETPSKYVIDLASQKASDVATHYTKTSDETLIIGSDTIVYADGSILGKPKDEEAARQMLRNLSGKTHEVYTGISLVHINKGTKTVFTAYECTKVHVNTLTEKEINAYILTNDPLDKAGAYGIQGYFSRHIRKIEGDYFNVVGLPVHLLYEELKRHNFI